MKGQSEINLIYISVGILITMVVIYFLYGYLTNSPLETITSPFVISNFILNNFQEQIPGSCSFSISFTANQNLNLSLINAGFLLSNGEYLYPDYKNYTSTISFINSGQYLYYLNPKPGWAGYNKSVCSFLSSSIISKTNYITGMTRIIANKTKIFQRFAGNIQFLVNTPNTNPQDIYGDSVIGITATHNLGAVIIKGITNSTFSEETSPGTYIYLPEGKYTVFYTSEGSGSIFLLWNSVGGISIQSPQLNETNMTIINNGEIIIDNTLSLIPPANFNITENQTETLIGNKVNVTADYVSGYYTFYVNKLPYSGCVNTQNKSCVITESSPGTYNITASYKSSTVNGVSNKLQETFNVPIYHFSITENQTKTLSGNSVNITIKNVLENYTFYVDGIPYSGCTHVESKTCIITESSPGTYNISASYNSSTSNGVSNTIQEIFYVYPFLYITIQNTQSIATSSPFQQEIIFDANNYTQYESSTLGNIRILNSQNKQVNFWCESGCYNTSTRTTIFVKLPNGISALASKQYKLEFLNKSIGYNGTTAGEAPQLSSNYGEYDNAKYVFNSYWNFAGTTLPTGLNESTSSGSTITANNGITISVSGDTYGANYIETPNLIAISNITEVGFETMQSSVGYGGVNIPSVILTNNWSKQQSYAFNNYYNGTNPPHMFAYYGTDNTGIGTRMVSSNRYTQSGNMWSIAINSAGTLAYMSYTNYGSPSVQIQGSSTEVTLSNDYSAVITTQAGITQIYYMLTRSYPPNGIMPTISFGNIQQ